MILRILLYSLLFFLVLIESTLIPFPFVLIVSVITFLLFPQVRTLVVIFIAAFALDSLRLHMVGITPLLIFVIIFLLSFNERLFDIRDFLYILSIVVLGSIIYSNIVGYQINAVILGMICGIGVIVGSVVLKKQNRKDEIKDYFKA